MNLLTLATELDAVGSLLAEAGCLAAPVVPEIPPPPRHVDCGSCRACCHMAVFLRPEEEGYDVQEGTRILKRREEDGACVYLDHERGCTIYARRPVACRAFACADFVRHAYGDRPALPDEHPQFQRVIAEGRKRLHEPAQPVKDPPVSFSLEVCCEMDAAGRVISAAPLPAEVRVFLQAAMAGIDELPDAAPDLYLDGVLTKPPGRWVVSIKASGHLCAGRGGYEASTAQIEVKRVFVAASGNR